MTTVMWSAAAVMPMALVSLAAKKLQLGAVEQPAVRRLLGGGLERRGVAAAVRLGQGERGRAVLPGRDRLDVALLLLLRAVLADHLGDHVGHRHRHGGGLGQQGGVPVDGGARQRAQ